MTTGILSAKAIIWAIPKDKFLQQKEKTSGKEKKIITD